MWMPTERQFHLHNGGEGEFSALFNVVWPSGGEIKLTDKQKLLYTILTRSDFIVTSMEHLYCGTSPGGTVNGSGQTEGVNFGGLTTNLTTRSSGNPITSSGQQPVEEELASVATSHDVESLTTSVLRPTRPTLNHERGFSQAATINEEQVFASAKPPSRRQSLLNTLNVKEKENNAVKQRERNVVAEERAAKADTKGPVPTSLFGGMSENSTTVIAETEKLDDCYMPPPQQLPDPNGWVQFLGRRDKKERRHHAVRQGDDKESVVEQEETLSPADTKYIKLILSEEERMAISKTLDRNYEATKYGVASTRFRKNAVPPPPSNPVSMEMLIEMAPSATAKVSFVQSLIDSLSSTAPLSSNIITTFSMRRISNYREKRIDWKKRHGEMLKLTGGMEIAVLLSYRKNVLWLSEAGEA